MAETGAKLSFLVPLALALGLVPLRGVLEEKGSVTVKLLAGRFVHAIIHGSTFVGGVLIVCVMV